MRLRSSEVELANRHCPAAWVHSQIGTPREILTELIIGRVVHAIIQAIASEPEASPARVADEAVKAIMRNGMSFEQGKPDFPKPEEAIEGHELALSFLDKHPLPENTLSMVAELQVDLGIGWSVVEEGSEGAIWRQALDLVSLSEEEDAYGLEVLVASSHDWKGWNWSPEWFKGLQGRANAVSLEAYSRQSKPDILRRHVGSYRLRAMAVDEIDLRTEGGQGDLETFRRGLELVCDSMADVPLDVEATARPGEGCFAGFGGCPYFTHCEPAQRRRADIEKVAKIAGVAVGQSGRSSPDDAFGSIEGAARAFAISSAARNAAMKELKSYGGGPISVTDGWLVGWKDTTTPTGTVDETASFLLSEQWAIYVSKRPDDQPRIESLLRAEKMGVTQVRQIVYRLQSAGLDGDEAEGLLGRCLGPKPGRKLDIYKGALE